MELVALAVAVLLFPIGWWIVTYNRFVRLGRAVNESWADIDVELKRRYELIPNLVAAVKGYATFERETLRQVVELRSAAMAHQGPTAAQSRDENALQDGLRSFFAVAENYPQLKSDAGFRALQQELANTEDRIAAARRFFNGNVRDLKNLQQSFPTSLVNRHANIPEPSFFELEDANERVVPRVATTTTEL